MTDTEKLLEKIESSGLKKMFVAESIGLTYQGFLNKLQNKTEFTSGEIANLCSLLGITRLTEKESIFFAKHID